MRETRKSRLLWRRVSPGEQTNTIDKKRKTKQNEKKKEKILKQMKELLRITEKYTSNLSLKAEDYTFMMVITDLM